MPPTLILYNLLLLSFMPIWLPLVILRNFRHGRPLFAGSLAREMGRRGQAAIAEHRGAAERTAALTGAVVTR